METSLIVITKQNQMKMKVKNNTLLFHLNFSLTVFASILPRNTFFLDSPDISSKQRCAWLVNGASGDYFHDWKKDKAKYMTPEDRCLLKIKDDHWNDANCTIRKLFICTKARE